MHPVLVPAICKAANPRHINSISESSISVRLSFSLRSSYLPSLYRPFHPTRDSQISIATIAPCPATGTTPAPTTMDGCRRRTPKVRTSRIQHLLQALGLISCQSTPSRTHTRERHLDTTATPRHRRQRRQSQTRATSVNCLLFLFVFYP
jgi:hypothetical protein